METKIISMSERERAMPAGIVREMPEEAWVDRYASGSLRKAKALGFSYRALYLEERCAHDFGWTFRVLPRTRVTFGDAMMEGDCPPLTETCWFANRILARNPFPDSDVYEVKYIKTYTTDVTGEMETEGVGLIVRQSSANWMSAGHLAFVIIAEWKGSGWESAKNPC